MTVKLRALEEVVEERRLSPNDCRTCRNFQPAEDGLSYGWCPPHRQYVKLYHPAGTFYSQCRFKAIRHPKREALI
jgi:hypothetical protein